MLTSNVVYKEKHKNLENKTQVIKNSFFRSYFKNKEHYVQELVYFSLHLECELLCST